MQHHLLYTLLHYVSIKYDSYGAKSIFTTLTLVYNCQNFISLYPSRRGYQLVYIEWFDNDLIADDMISSTNNYYMFKMTLISC